MNRNLPAFLTRTCQRLSSALYITAIFVIAAESGFHLLKSW